MPSFHSRIRWSSLSLITILLLIFGASLYSTLSFLLHRHVDAQLVSIAQSQANRVKQETGEIEEILRKNSRQEQDDDDLLEKEDHELREAIRSSVVLNREGTVQWKGDGVGVIAGLEPILLNQVLEGVTIYENLQHPPGPPLRRISFPITSQGTVRYILQSQTSLDLVNETLRWLIITLGAMTLGVFVCAWVGSNWIARMALSPIKTLGQTPQRYQRNPLILAYFWRPPTRNFNNWPRVSIRCWNGCREYLSHSVGLLEMRPMS